MSQKKPTVLITGATGQIGREIIRNLANDDSITLIAAVRSVAKAELFENQGIRSVIFDFDKEDTLIPALQDIDRVFLMTGYTVDMLRQSKVFLDHAKRVNVKHIVHLGACGRDDTTVAHWAWHQLIERYIEWSGFSFTHLRPEVFMQNLLSYDGEKAVKNGVIQQFTGDSPFSWVDGDDVAAVAAEALLYPEKHTGKTYRLGYDAKSYNEVAEIMSKVLEQPFRYESLSPEVFLDNMRAAGADMAYMKCVSENFQRIQDRTIPGVEDISDNFQEITGRNPTLIEDFVKKHRNAFIY